MTFFVADEPAYRASIASVLQPFGAELLAGGPYAIAGDPAQYLNSAFLLSADGEIRDRYDKRLLLPFAEYFPFARVDLLRRGFGRVREFVPGRGPLVLETSIGPTGIVICNEGFFPEPAAERVRAGATVLVNLSNDSWLGDPKYSEPAFDMVTLRAVEQRRWIVRVSTAGPSAVIDPFGRVAARTTLFETTAFAALVEPRTGTTHYGRLGDAFAWACLLLSGLAWLAIGRRGEDRASRHQASPAHAPGGTVQSR
jgi:apolipoprotein N-acyltransferase